LAMFGAAMAIVCSSRVGRSLNTSRSPDLLSLSPNHKMYPQGESRLLTPVPSE
jgi:hypothetical protein